MAKRLGTFKKILEETLLPSSHKVTKWPWRGRTSLLPWLALQGSARLIINGAAAEMFYTRESRKQRVNGKGTEEKEDYVDETSSFFSFLPLPFTPLTKYTFSRYRGRDR